MNIFNFLFYLNLSILLINASFFNVNYLLKLHISSISTNMIVYIFTIYFLDIQILIKLIKNAI